MVEPPAAADFSDELFMLDFTDDSAGAGKEMRNPNPSRRRPAHFLQEIFDAAVDGLPVFAAEEGSQGGGDDEDEEEELEWLANKDAFPALETSFDLSAQSLSSEGGGRGGSGVTAAAASGERPSPVSVLASALLFRAPAKSRSKGLRRRRKALTTFISPPPGVPSAAAAMEGGKGEKRKCRHCESSETPQWRAGPEGPKTLCNACGVRYKSGRLVPEYRPANSPTFSAAIHSNSHRRVVEMRRQKYGGGGGHGRGRRGSKRVPPPPLLDGLAIM